MAPIGFDPYLFRLDRQATESGWGGRGGEEVANPASIRYLYRKHVTPHLSVT
jgi:hypothetical protein